MQVSVLIPTAPKKSLVALLNSLKGQPYIEVLIDFEQGSPAQVRNRLARKAKGDMLLFLDDDIILAPDFIAQGIRYLQETKEAVAQSRVVGKQENGPDKCISTAFWVCHEAYDELGGFDESFPFFNEDVDFFHRAGEVGYINSSVCFHPGQGAFEKLQEGNRILKAKHPEFYESLKKEMR